MSEVTQQNISNDVDSTTKVPCPFDEVGNRVVSKSYFTLSLGRLSEFRKTHANIGAMLLQLCHSVSKFIFF